MQIYYDYCLCCWKLCKILWRTSCQLKTNASIVNQMKLLNKFVVHTWHSFLTPSQRASGAVAIVCPWSLEKQALSSIYRYSFNVIAIASAYRKKPKNVESEIATLEGLGEAACVDGYDARRKQTFAKFSDVVVAQKSEILSFVARRVVVQQFDTSYSVVHMDAIRRLICFREFVRLFVECRYK